MWPYVKCCHLPALNVKQKSRLTFIVNKASLNPSYWVEVQMRFSSVFWVFVVGSALALTTAGCGGGTVADDWRRYGLDGRAFELQATSIRVKTGGACVAPGVACTPEEAAAYCQSIGARLPSYDELWVAYQAGQYLSVDYMTDGDHYAVFGDGTDLTNYHGSAAQPNAFVRCAR
jgi:hypothetical protein